MTDEPVLITIAEAARITGLSTTTLYRWARVGAIPAKRIGSRTLRFSRREIEAWAIKSKAPVKKRSA